MALLPTIILIYYATMSASEYKAMGFTEMGFKEIEVVNSVDPKCAELEILGYVVVGESWGAHMHLEEPLNLAAYEMAITRAIENEFHIEVLSPESAEQVLELEIANNADYPFTPATEQKMPSLESVTKLWSPTSWVFGAYKDDLLVGVGATSRDHRGVNIDFGSVRREYRGKGLGFAIASLGIVHHAHLGDRDFSTGGAAINEASKATVTKLGFAIDEIWRSYKAPGQS